MLDRTKVLEKLNTLIASLDVVADMRDDVTRGVIRENDPGWLAALGKREQDQKDLLDFIASDSGNTPSPDSAEIDASTWNVDAVCQHCGLPGGH